MECKYCGKKECLCSTKVLYLVERLENEFCSYPAKMFVDALGEALLKRARRRGPDALLVWEMACKLNKGNLNL